MEGNLAVRHRSLLSRGRFFDGISWQYTDITFDHELVVAHYLLAIFLSLVAVVVKLYFARVLGQNTPFLLFFSAILASGWIGGIGPALVATIISAVSASYFFLGAASNWTLSSLESIQIVVFVLEGFFIGIFSQVRLRSDSLLKARVKQQAVIAQLGHYALTGVSLSSLMERIAEFSARTLN